jgi:hypothetical protein
LGAVTNPTILYTHTERIARTIRSTSSGRPRRPVRGRRIAAWWCRSLRRPSRRIM